MNFYTRTSESWSSFFVDGSVPFVNKKPGSYLDAFISKDRKLVEPESEPRKQKHGLPNPRRPKIKLTIKKTANATLIWNPKKDGNGEGEAMEVVDPVEGGEDEEEETWEVVDNPFLKPVRLLKPRVDQARVLTREGTLFVEEIRKQTSN